MLRFQLISDIHGRFNKVQWDTEADLVLCAGDVSENVEEGIKFLKTSPTPIIFIPGNHEFYKGNYFDRIDYLKEECEKSNGHITYADNEVFYIDNIRIISSTLWSNFNHFDPLLVSSTEYRMNDYSYIKTKDFFKRRPDLEEKYNNIISNYVRDIQMILRGKNEFNKKIMTQNLQEIHKRFSLPFNNIKEMLEGMPYRKEMFSPVFSYLLFKESRDFLDNALLQEHEGKTLVMTHHAPSYSALSMSRYAVDIKAVDMHPLLKRYIIPNKIGAYTSALEGLVVKHKNIDAWVHGHLHDRMLYRLGTATVHCNATGIVKNSEQRTGYDNYCFYLNDDFKRQGTINLINHIIYKTNKINLFLEYLVINKLVEETFDDLDKLKGLYYENYILIKTLKTVPDVKLDLKFFKNFKDLTENMNLKDRQMIISSIIQQNNELKEILISYLDRY